MNIGITEIIIVALIILLLFGGKKIPELMRGLGKGVRSFKDGVNGKEEGEEQTKEQTKDSSADTNDKVSEQK